MDALLQHVRIGLARTTPRSGTRFRRSFLLMAALLLAAQPTAPAGGNLVSAAPRNIPAPASVPSASSGAAGVPDIADIEYTGTGGGPADAVQVVDGRAYLLESNKLIVLDIHNPAAPQWIGEYR